MILSDSFKKYISKNLYFFIFLFVLVFASFINSLGNDFVSDDKGLVLHVPTYTFVSIINPFVFLRTGLYFMLYNVFGLNEEIFRIPNIIFHLGSVWLLFLIISKIKNKTVGFMSAAIFAVHPILVEPVVWISGGVYPQYSFFFLLSFVLYIVGQNKKKYYLLSLLFFSLSLLSSEKAVTLCLVPILYEISFGNIRRRWRETSGYVVLSILYLFFTFIMGRFTEKVVGLLSAEQGAQQTLYNPLQQIPIAVSSYIELIFWPDGLTLYHSEMIFSTLEFFVKVVIFFGYVGLLGYSYKRNKFLFFWLMFFVISLLPTLTPFGISWIVAERYAYLGSAGIFAVIAFYFYKASLIKKFSLYVYTFFALIIFCLFIRTVIRNTDWKNEDNLWLSAAKTSPSSSQNHNNLGDYYGRHGDINNAIREFKTAIDLKPNYADAHHNLGNAYRDAGDASKAIESYKRALFINPKLWQSYQNIAAIYFFNEKYDLALEYIEKGLSVDPENVQLLWAEGTIYAKLEQKNKAVDIYRKILLIDPGNKTVLTALDQINK